MALSGSIDFTSTRDQLIIDAFQLIGVYGIGRTVSSEDMSYASRALNKLIKSWATHGLHLWARAEATLIPTAHVSKYLIGNNNSTTRVGKTNDTIMTQLTADAATSATSLTVDSTDSMTVGDFIGIVMTDNTAHWTTIATIPTSTTLTITTGLSGAASTSAMVYTYTTRLPKPLRINSVRQVTGFDSGATSTVVETPLYQMAYTDYIEMNKTNSGTPVAFAYRPNLLDLEFHLWPRPNTENMRICFTYERTLEDVDDIDDNFDFPSEWLEPLTWKLAVRLAPAFGKYQKLKEIDAPASAMLDNLLAWDTETSSICIVPDMDRW